MADADQDKRPESEQVEQPEGAEAAPAKDTAQLEQELAEAREKADENWNQFLRARAELDNTRRRAERELEQAQKYAVEKFANEMLSVKDSLEMGVAASQEADADIVKVREGLELTLKMLRQALERFEVVEVNPLGERFDPARHEAMAAQESQEQEANTVLHVVQKGYMLHDRLLRPAMVIVAKAPSGGNASGSIDEQA